MNPDLFNSLGYSILPSGLDSGWIEKMRLECDRLQSEDSRSRAGIRNPLGKSEILSKSEIMIRAIARKLIGSNTQPVRSILFDKTPETNWDVVWHQDVTIAVMEKMDVPGFGPWSTKVGIPHVQPTAAVLEQMVTLRLHLDDCPEDNGALLVVPKSHTSGFVDIKTLDTKQCDAKAIICQALIGDIVAMRPLILHASKKSLQPGHRRVLHIEYASRPLPGGLEWA